ncbi:MAG: AAA family ATPase [Candidatus Krumholzibacteriia bacterium]
MYLDHFGLGTDPFPLYPSLKFVFLSSPFEETMAHLAYGLEQDEDIVLISGPIGTGKTLAVHSLLANVAKRYQTALVNVTQIDFPELLKLVLADLGAPVTGPADRADLLGALRAQVDLVRAGGQKILIVVDEAQNLAPEVLEGLRLVTNIGQPGSQALQLVLAGQPDLERKINLPELAQLRQRIRVHYRLETLSREEVAAYIAHRVKVAGCERPLFRPKAIDLIHRASSGVPRLVNILASRALLSAFVAGKKEVDVEHVDLDDLPPATGVAAHGANPATAPEVTRVASPVPPVPPRPEDVLPPVAPAVPDRSPVAEPASARPAQAAPLPPPRPAVPVAADATPPFSPSAAFQRRNRRGRLFFLLALLVLGVGALAVFSLQPDEARRSVPSERIATPRVEPAAAPATQTPDRVMPPTVAGDSTVASVAAAAADTARPPAESPVTPGVSGVTPPAPAPARTPAPVAAAVGDTVYAVHVHSFHDMNRVKVDIAAFQKAGFPVFFREVQVEGQLWQRVYVGPYGSLPAAQEAARRLHEQGVATYALIVRLGHGER